MTAKKTVHFRSANWQLAAGLLLASFAMVPLLVVPEIPFVDYPNHLARQYIFDELRNTQALREYYVINEGLYPYWGIRLMLSAIGSITGIDTAGKVFVLIATAMPALGALCVAYVLNHSIPWPAVGVWVFSHNQLMVWGFHNFTFSTGVALLIFSGWLLAQHWKATLRIPVFAALGLGLAFLHLLASAIFIILVAAWMVAGMLSDWRRFNRTVISCVLEVLVFSVPLACYASLLHSEHGNPLSVMLGSLPLQIAAIVSPLHTGYSIADSMLGIWISGIVFAGLWLRVIRLPAPRAWFVGLLAVAAAIAPFALMGVTFINMRLPLFVFLLLLSCSKLQLPASRVSIILATLFLVFAFGKSVLFTQDALRRANQVAEFRQAIKRLPEGSKIFTARQKVENSTAAGFDQDFRDQIINYAIIDAHAFVPRLFTMYGVGYTSSYAEWVAPVSTAMPFELLDIPHSRWPDAQRSFLRYAKDWRDRYDFVIVLTMTPQRVPLPQTEMAHLGTFFQILRIIKKTRPEGAGF